jgi:hypothetical protein
MHPSISQAIINEKCLVIGHTGDYVKSYNLCMILMCLTSPHKNNMGAFVVRTFFGLVKIIQNLYDD